MRSLRPLAALCTCALVTSACTSTSTRSEPAATQAATSTASPSPTTTDREPAAMTSDTADLSRFNATFATRYAEEDIAGALAHYHPSVTWHLTNGAHKSSRAEVPRALEALRTSGAGSFEFGDHAHHPLKQGHVTTDAFSFNVAPEKRVSGTRYALWNQDGQIIEDLWVPQSPEQAPLRAEVDAYLEALSKAYTSGEVNTLGELYTEDATLVLSDGKRFVGESTHEMLGKVAAMGVETMTIATSEVHPASDTHTYVLSTQRFSLPGPDGPITLAAHTLRLLQRTDQGWRTRAELAWPAP